MQSTWFVLNFSAKLPSDGENRLLRIQPNPSLHLQEPWAQPTHILLWYNHSCWISHLYMKTASLSIKWNISWYLPMQTTAATNACFACWLSGCNTWIVHPIDWQTSTTAIKPDGKTQSSCRPRRSLSLFREIYFWLYSDFLFQVWEIPLLESLLFNAVYVLNKHAFK